MKLADVARHNDDLLLGVTRQLEFGRMKELASYVTVDDAGGSRAFVATDAGLFVGEVVNDGPAARSVEGTLTPWSEVSGTRMAFSGFRTELNHVLVTVAVPPFRASTHQPGDTQALIDFADICTRRQGRSSGSNDK